MRFLSVGPGLCLRLPSDSASRRTPLPSGYRFPPSGSEEDLHLQVTNQPPPLIGWRLRATRHAWRTTIKKALISQGLSDFAGLSRNLTGAVEWNRTITELPPPAPQAGASTSSATTASRVYKQRTQLYMSEISKPHIPFNKDELSNTAVRFYQVLILFFLCGRCRRSRRGNRISLLRSRRGSRSLNRS